MCGKQGILFQHPRMLHRLCPFLTLSLLRACEEGAAAGGELGLQRHAGGHPLLAGEVRFYISRAFRPRHSTSALRASGTTQDPALRAVATIPAQTVIDHANGRTGDRSMRDQGVGSKTPFHLLDMESTTP